MPADQLASANELLANPQEVDVSAAARQLGFHVVARLADRHGIEVSLTPTPGCGLTAVLVLPAALFSDPAGDDPAGDTAMNTPGDGLPARVPVGAVPAPREGATGGARPDATAGAPSTVPATGAFVFDGRHSWPGAEPEPASESESESDDVLVEDAGSDDEDAWQEGGPGGRRRATHAVDGAPTAAPATTSAPAPGRPGAVVGAAPRRELIHPIVVPPPAPPAVDEGLRPA